MRTLLCLLFSLTLMAQGKQSMAVLKFDRMTNDAELQVDYPITEKVMAMLLETNRFQMVERGRVDSIVEELRFQNSSGLVNPATASRFGQMTGASFLVQGVLRMNFGVLRTTAQLDLRVISTETGNVQVTLAAKGGSSSLSLNASTEGCMEDLLRNLRTQVARAFPTRATIIMAVNSTTFVTDIPAGERRARYRVFQGVTGFHPVTHEKINTLVQVGEAEAVNRLGEGSLLLKVRAGQIAPGMFAELLPQ